MEQRNTTSQRKIGKRWRKHHALFWTTGVFVLLMLLVVQVNAGKREIALALVDRSGDRSALAQVTINGELGDGYHRTLFTIQGGEIASDTEVYPQPRNIGLQNYVRAGAVRLNDKEYEVLPFPMYDGDHDYEIVSRESRTWIDAGQRQEERAFVQTSTSLHIPKTENTITHANMPTAGLIELEGDIYFTVPATANSSGINAIYKLNFVNHLDAYRNENGQYNSEQIVQFPMEEAGSEGDKEIEVLGLEAAGGQLILILSVDRELVLRSYDHVSGEQTGELYLPEVPLSFSEQEYLEEPFAGERHSTNYEAFSDEEGHILTLRFNSNQSTAKTQRQTLISVEFSEGALKLLDQVQGSYTERASDSYRELFYAHHADGKLFVIKTLNLWESDPRIHFDIGFPKRFVIYAYENGELIYEGELVSNQNDDAIQVRNYQGGSLGYNETDYRNYYNIRIE